jgi:hypothetical protein
MSRWRDRLEEDRALRDSAWALFRRELAHVRREVTPQALGERIAGRIGEKVEAVSDDAVDLVLEHRRAISGAAGAIAAGIGLWLARKPIMARLRPLFGGKDESDDTDGTSDEENDE